LFLSLEAYARFDRMIFFGSKPQQESGRYVRSAFIYRGYLRPSIPLPIVARWIEQWLSHQVANAPLDSEYLPPASKSLKQPTAVRHCNAEGCREQLNCILVQSIVEWVVGGILLDTCDTIARLLVRAVRTVRGATHMRTFSSCIGFLSCNLKKMGE
jgi:hypothetical protein